MASNRPKGVVPSSELRYRRYSPPRAFREVKIAADAGLHANVFRPIPQRPRYSPTFASRSHGFNRSPERSRAGLPALDRTERPERGRSRSPVRRSRAESPPLKVPEWIKLNLANQQMVSPSASPSAAASPMQLPSPSSSPSEEKSQTTSTSASPLAESFSNFKLNGVYQLFLKDILQDRSFMAIAECSRANKSLSQSGEILQSLQTASLDDKEQYKQQNVGSQLIKLAKSTCDEANVFMQIFFRYYADNVKQIQKVNETVRGYSQSKKCISFIEVQLDQNKPLILVAISGKKVASLENSGQKPRILKNIEDMISRMNHAGSTHDYLFLEENNSKLDEVIKYLLTNKRFHSTLPRDYLPNQGCSEKPIILTLIKLFLQFGSRIKIIGMVNVSFYPYLTEDFLNNKSEAVISHEKATYQILIRSNCKSCRINKPVVLGLFKAAQTIGDVNQKCPPQQKRSLSPVPEKVTVALGQHPSAFFGNGGGGGSSAAAAAAPANSNAMDISPA